MLLWGLLLGTILLVAGGWFMHRYGEEGSAGEILSLPSRLILTAAMLGMIGFVFKTLGPVITLFLVLIFGLILGIMWVPSLVSLALNPLSGAMTGGNEQVERVPYYSRAHGLRKRGEYSDALHAVDHELSKFPGHAEGLLLKAEIYAEDLKDPRAALAVLREIATTPGRPAEEVCRAWHQIADLQWKHLQDIEGARVALETIVTEFPETTSAQLAQQRLAHLSGAAGTATAAATARLVVKEHTVRLGLTEDLGASQIPREDGVRTAADLVRHLEEHPQDWEARERLARLYVDPIGRLDLATDQLERLLAETTAPNRHVVRWFNELADLQIKAPDGIPAARLTLERIIARFPDSPWSAQAEARLRHLVYDERAKNATPVVKLGRYEPNLGLRRGDASIPDPEKMGDNRPPENGLTPPDSTRSS